MAGSVRHRGGDRYEIRIWRPKDLTTGKRKQYSKIIHATSKRAAQKVADRKAVEIENDDRQGLNDFLGIEPHTMAEIFETHFEAKAGDWSERTKKNQRLLLDRHLLPALGGIRITDLNAMDVERCLAKLGQANATKAHQFIANAIKRAMRYELVDRNVADLAERPKPKKATTAKRRPPTKEELAIFLSTADDTWRTLLTFAAITGARRGEICALTWGDLDLTAGLVTIDKSMIEATGNPDGNQIKATKTDRGRVVPMGDHLTATMVEYRSRTAEEIQLPTPPTRVFPTWVPHSISQRIGRETKALGLTGVTFHSLRHFTGTQLVAAGEDVVTVAARLGHARPTTTLAFYSHGTGQRDRAAADVIGSVVLGDPLDRVAGDA